MSRGKMYKGASFSEEYDLEFDGNDLIKERVLRNDFSKMYTLKDISRWVEYGIRNGLVKRSAKKEDVEMIMKWIELLNKKKVDL